MWEITKNRIIFIFLFTIISLIFIPSFVMDYWNSKHKFTANLYIDGKILTSEETEHFGDGVWTKIDGKWHHIGILLK